jgi:hypothetical protein
MNIRIRLVALCVLVPVQAGLAGVGDPTLRTDHPHYPGEGAFQTAADCVAFATRGVADEQERAIAVFQWLLAHQFHLPSPQECFVPGVVPGSRNDDYEMVVYDAAKGRFSYGYGLCGTVHAWNEPYWHALGMRPAAARSRATPTARFSTAGAGTRSTRTWRASSSAATGSSPVTRTSRKTRRSSAPTSAGCLTTPLRGPAISTE